MANKSKKVDDLTQICPSSNYIRLARVIALGVFDERLCKMNSIVPECTSFKHEYDKCFNEWFSTKFLKGQTKLPSECDKLFQRYRECIKPMMDNEIKIHEIIDIDT